MNKFKRFFKQNKIKFIALAVCLTFGGVSTATSFIGTISTLLYIISLALAVQLTFEWRDFEKSSE